jgi:hypothetical protein
MVQQQQSTAEEAVKQTIIQFAAAADNRDAASLDQLLDGHFRIGMNRLFGSTELMTMDKSGYLNKIKTGEFGGDKREVSIENITIVQNNAMAKTIFKGSRMTIVTLLQLIKTSEGKWRVLNDIPTVL